MTTAPSPANYEPTGVWLYHSLGFDADQNDLFQKFSARGGQGIILYGGHFPEDISESVEIVRALGLQVVLTIPYETMVLAESAEKEVASLSYLVGLVDALMIDFQDRREFPSSAAASSGSLGAEVSGAGLLQGLDIPEKPWFVLANTHTDRERAFQARLPGRLAGLFVDRAVGLGSKAWEPSKIRNLVDGWNGETEGGKAVFLNVPEIGLDETAAGDDPVSDFAAAARQAGIKALAIDSREYTDRPQVQQVAERLVGFPDRLPRTPKNGRIIGRHEGKVWSLAMTPEGQVVSGGEDGTVRLWDLGGGNRAEEPLGGHQGSVWSVAVTPEHQVVSGGTDGSLRLWGLDGNRDIEPLGQLDGWVNAIAVSSEGHVAAAGEDGWVRFWGPNNDADADIDLGFPVNAVAFTPGGQVVYGGVNGVVYRSPQNETDDRELLSVHVGWVLALAATTGGHVISGGSDGQVLVWAPDGAEEIGRLGSHDGPVFVMVITQDNQVVTGGKDGVLRRWDPDRGGELTPLGQHEGWVTALAVTTAGQVVSGDQDGTIRVLDIPPSVMDIQPSAISDQASLKDLLNFGYLVKGLDAMLNHPKTGLPLAIAVTAPWGTGKSSVMLQLKQSLENGGSNATRRKWYTVEFPAWRYEKSERLWAALAKEIYDIQKTQITNPFAGAWFRVSLEWSRLGWWQYLGRNLALPVLAGGLAVAATAVAQNGAGVVASLGGGGVLALLTSGGFSGILGNPFKRSVNAYAARPKFEEQLGFTAEAQRDIEHLMRKLAPKPKVSGNKQERAIAVFVDDLDRCSPKHVVDVIESINQIFNSVDANCVFILGMDRQVVAHSIEVAYIDMVKYLSEQNVPLAKDYGYRFLEKIVQMSLSVLSADTEGMKRLLEDATGFKAPCDENSSDQPQGARTVEPPPQESVTEKIAILKGRAISNPADVRQERLRSEAETPGTEEDQRAWDEAEKTVRTENLESESPDVLRAEYAAIDYLDTNPRQIKRFINAFRLQLHVAGDIGDLPLHRMSALAKWVAIRLRWPHLAEDLDRDPGLLAALETYAFSENPEYPKDTKYPWFGDKELIKILKDQTNGPDRLTTIIGDGLVRVA
jgi:hypothetical protein